MYEMEKLNRADPTNNGKTDQSAYRMANIISIVYQLKSYVSLINALYFQPDISDFNDFRMLNELSILFSITRYLKLDISSVWRHDSQPPVDLEKNDVSIHMGIVLTIPGKE
jgi:hypothetical protein